MPGARQMGLSIDVRLASDDLREALARDVERGLTADRKELSPKWLYDERGCELFDEITRLPEYYPTRAERSILGRRADDIARLSGADTLVELGSGTSDKTRILLDALSRAGTLRRFAPFDVAESTLRAAGRAIVDEYPGVVVEGVVGDFEQHLDALPRGGRRMVAFLGGTIGNLYPEQRRRMLHDIAAALEPDDCFLLGTDLVKDRHRLVRAYDDAAGVTAAFNRNVLAMINRELSADFELERFEHVARFDERQSWIEMRLRADRDQRVHVRDLDLTVDIARGEDIRTEISTKFVPEKVEHELEAVGLDVAAWWTDDDGDFALWLAVR